MQNPVKLQPVYKDYIWGGTKLKQVYGKGGEQGGNIAESWELSTHPDGECLIAEGPDKGTSFAEYLKKQEGNAVGSKAEGQEPPILIKFIDAKENLSVQVHPDNEYALKNENDYGKTEMWIVLSHEPGAALYYGVNRDITKEEMKERIQNHTIMEVLNRVEVQDGDVFFIPAGTIHAIGAGMVICEIQQRSNVTYRLYDYGRVGKDGKERELHIEKALETANLKAIVPDRKEAAELYDSDGNRLELLDFCPYFQTYQYDFRTELHFSTGRKTFMCLIMLEGEADLHYGNEKMNMVPGDTFFLPAQEARYTVTGIGRMIAVTL